MKDTKIELQLQPGITATMSEELFNCFLEAEAEKMKQEKAIEIISDEEEPGEKDIEIIKNEPEQINLGEAKLYTLEGASIGVLRVLKILRKEQKKKHNNFRDELPKKTRKRKVW